MWKSVVGHSVSTKASAGDDDWETDPDFENDVSEQEQRWGAKTIEGSGRKEHISVAELRHKVASEHEQVKLKEQTPKASYGYGGKFGVEKDRMDKAALGHDYVAQVEQHSSQKDASRGFGGKYGVQKDRVDKSAMTFEYKGEVQKHTSQSDYSKGFGGKYGVETEKVDKAALGFDYKGETEKHQSQKDYSKGFGGKYGVETEKVDKAALGFDYKGETEKHQSQKDYSAGFGGRYGVQKDRMDKSAAAFSDMDSPASAYEKTQPFEASSSGAGKLKVRFENLAKASDEENMRRVEEERARRRARESREREEAALRQQQEEPEEDVPHQPEIDAAPEFQPPPDVYHHMTEIEELPEIEFSSTGSLDEVVERRSRSEEAEYEDVPPLPPRSEDFAHVEVPSPPAQCSEAVEDTYEEISETPYSAMSAADADYEDLSGGISATAIYDYIGEGDDELSFNPDDIITNIEMIDEGWWRGHCNGHFGLFPAAYVQLN